MTAAHRVSAWLRRRPAGAWAAVAVAVFGLAFATLFRPLLGADWSLAAPAWFESTDELPPALRHWGGLARTDHRFVAWLVGRNADALVRRPARLFDAGICHPEPRSLALGESGIALGVAGLPVQLAGGDPVTTLNFALCVVTWVAALAMYLLVRHWTGLPAAGIVAGLLFAFHPIRSADVVHPYLGDAGWTLLAFFFASRLCERGRWRDALGLVTSATLQLAGSPYPLVSAALLSLILLPALLARHGLRGQRAGPWLLVGLAGLAAAWLLLGPYLELARAGTLEVRELRAHAPWSQLAPGALRFPGWLPLLLGGLALGLGRARCVGSDEAWDPRPAFVAGGLLLLLLATGGNAGDVRLAELAGVEPPASLPNPYDGLAALLPGLGMVRAPREIYRGVHLALCVLAGCGAAALLRSLPQRHRLAAGGALIALAFVTVLRPPWLGLEPRVAYALHRLAPEPEALELFRALEARGNRGPLLEIPTGEVKVAARSERVLLSAYHGRRTSACYNSFEPEGVAQVRELASRLPAADALARARELGFTTVLLHRRGAPALVRRLDAAFAEAAAAGRLRPLLATDRASAWEIP